MSLKILLVGALFFTSATLLAQGPPAFPREDRPESSEDARLRRERDKALNQKRQEDLKRDTDRLFKLAGELKAEVDKTSENVLSLDVIKKADEIEKLARSVRDKMKAQALEPMRGPEPPR
ncbi:MAG TPA: hypothetical protein VE998_13580 [Terriglobales bacterium]|nr:hypothetical protein [Terriglobales bacterium]